MSDTKTEGTAAPVGQDERDRLGRIVREVWVEYAEEHGDTDPSHLRGWDDLDEYNREVDRRIGERVAEVVRGTTAPVGEGHRAAKELEDENQQLREQLKEAIGDFSPPAVADAGETGEGEKPFEWQAFQNSLTGESQWKTAEDLGRMSIEGLMRENRATEGAAETGEDEWNQSVDRDLRKIKAHLAALPGQLAALRRDVDAQGDQQDQGFAGLITWQLEILKRLERLKSREHPKPDNVTDAMVEAVHVFNKKYFPTGGFSNGYVRGVIEAALAAKDGGT